MTRLRKDMPDPLIVVLCELLLVVSFTSAGLSTHYSPVAIAASIIIAFVLANIAMAIAVAVAVLIGHRVQSRVNSHISTFGRAGMPFFAAVFLLIVAVVAALSFDSTGHNVVLTAILIAAGTAVIGPLVIAGFVQVAQSMHGSDERRRQLRMNLNRAYYAARSRADVRPEVRVEWAAGIASDIGSTPVGYLDGYHDLPLSVAVGNANPDRLLEAIRLLDGPGDDEWMPVRPRLYYFPFAPLQPGRDEVAELHEDIERWRVATEDGTKTKRRRRDRMTPSTIRAEAASRAQRLGWTVDGARPVNHQHPYRA